VNGQFRVKAASPPAKNTSVPVEGPQSLSGSSGKEKHFLPFPAADPRLLGRSAVAPYLLWSFILVDILMVIECITLPGTLQLLEIEQ
jgi:hypothetical protein